MADLLDDKAGSDPRDTSVLAGLFGSEQDLARLVDRLTLQETEQLEAERNTFEQGRDALSGQLAEANGEIKRLDDELLRLDGKLGQVRGALEDAAGTTRELGASKAAHLGTLLARRAGYVARFASAKSKAYHEIRALLAAQWLDSERELFDWQKELHAIEMERRKLNEAEFARQSELLRSRQDSCHERLRQVEGLVTELRAVGITRTVSGFLLWAGYLSFAAVGWLVGEELQEAFRASGSATPSIFTAVGQGIAALVGAAGVAVSLATLFLGPLVLLGLAFGLLWLWDMGLATFDRHWTKSSRNARAGYAPTLWLNADLPVARTSYTDLLAKLPLIYLWSLVPLAMATIPALAGLAPSPGGAGGSPWDAALFTYAGTVMVLTATGFSLLYVTSVIKPRLINAAADSSRSGRFLNFELVSIAAVGLIAFVVLPMTRSWFPGLSSPWEIPGAYGISVAAVFVSFATAHGLVFHGIFKDLEKLQDEFRQYDLAIQESTALPSIEMTGEQAKQFKLRLNELYSDLDKLWSMPNWFTILTGRPDPSRSRFRVRGRWIAVTQEPPALVTPWDVLLEPSLAVEVQQTDANLVAAKQAEDGFRDEVRALEERRSQLREEQAGARRTVGHLAAELEELTRRHHTQLDRLGRDYADLIFQLRTAFHVGSSLAVRT